MSSVVVVTQSSNTQGPNRRTHSTSEQKTRRVRATAGVASTVFVGVFTYFAFQFVSLVLIGMGPFGLILVTVLSAASLAYGFIEIFRVVRARGVRMITVCLVGCWILSFVIPGFPVLVGLLYIAGCCIVILYRIAARVARSRTFALYIAALPFIGGLFYVPMQIDDAGLIISFRHHRAAPQLSDRDSINLEYIAEAVGNAYSDPVVVSYQIRNNQLYAYIARHGAIQNIELNTSPITQTPIPWLRWNLARRIDSFLSSKDQTNPQSYSRLAALVEPVKNLLGKESTVLVADGTLLNYSHQSVLDVQRVFRTVSLDAVRIQQNLQRWSEDSKVTSNDVEIVNGLPRNPSELEQLGISSLDWSAWGQLRRQFSQAAGQSLSKAAMKSPTKAGALQALQTKKLVIFIVAHYDGFSIRLPNGESIETKDLASIDRFLRKNHPRIFLMSCETARVRDEQSFTKALLDHGAEAVVAPVTRIAADEAIQLFKAFIDTLLNEASTSFSDAFRFAVEQTGVKNMEVWVAGRLRETNAKKG